MDQYIPHDDKLRAKNLKDFHGKTPKEIKERRWYHGTKEDFSSFRTGPSGAIYLSSDPEFASHFSEERTRSVGDPNVMPVHVRAEKPFDYENKKHIAALYEKLGPDLMFDPILHSMMDGVREGDWSVIESPQIQSAIKAMGHDSFYVQEADDSGEPSKNLAVYSPTQLKSATGNQGTFDPSNPDITKADGGALTDDEGITAYHGSPHDFEQFDTSKIGTGEGAQAYGHGLYFAGNEDVARTYRDMESKLLSKKSLSPEAYHFLDEYVSDQTNPIDWLNSAIAGAKKYRPHLVGEYKNLSPNDLSRTQKGRMYEVHINAHPDHFLDWDAPLSQQSEHVQKRLSPHHSILSQAAMDMFDGKPEDLSGSDLYQWLSGEHEGGLGSPKHVTEQLSNLGIKGIKYLDAGSRGQTDKPTRNYVVFDHNHVAVKRKYAQGGMVDEAA